MSDASNSEKSGVGALPRPERLAVRPMPRWKRAMDVVGASVALVLFSPIMAFAALAVRLSSPGPVVFKQRRAGLGGRPFTMYKFRTMIAGAEQHKEGLLHQKETGGAVFKIKDDPRITKVGRFLRKFSIDEMPQLWNVLKGEMSLVGPRPLPLEEIPCGAHLCRMPGHLCRMSVTPGLTCYWQVGGRSNLDLHRWIELDERYVRRRSFLTDVIILLRTVPAVLIGRGAH
jgi:lipopolysaccharide/colanic/teichoic acid biosynthesis glycosyltransferase